LFGYILFSPNSFMLLRLRYAAYSDSVQECDATGV